jgi:DNA-binding winged helix-turn-helix (wHTH) protein/TolB-like protein/Flp pilus assembly protein TadD
MEPAPVRVFAIGPFRLDFGRRGLYGADGAPVPLAGRAFDVLAFLVEHRYRVVSKDELLEAGWPRLVVEENNLAQAITAIRRALGDSREAPRYVATVAGRGYQFVGEVVPVVPAATPVPVEVSLTPTPMPPAPPSAPPPVPVPVSRRGVLIGAAAGAAALGGGLWYWRSRRSTEAAAGRIGSLAVLPFRPLGGESRDAAMELGMTELLINRLSELPDLRVAPLSSVLVHDQSDDDPLEAGRALGVDAVVEGAIQIRDGRVRATVRLVEVSGGRALWSGRYTERFDDFFAVQDSIAAQVSAALAIVAPGATPTALASRGTRNPVAWQYYATGRFLLGQREARDVVRAREAFEEAERIDPQFAQAVAAQSDAWMLAAVFSIEPERQAMQRAKLYAERALATRLGPYLPEAHAALGHAQTNYDFDLVAGRESFRRALTLRPVDSWAHALLALNLTMSRRFPLAFAHIRSAREHEPSAMPYAALEGWVTFFSGDLTASERIQRSILERLPMAPLPRQFLARALLAQGGRGAEVVTLLETYNPPAPFANSNLPRAYAQAGRRADALAALERLEARGRQGYTVNFELAMIHAELGDTERALAAVAKSPDDRSVGLLYANSEPLFAALRAEPRFVAAIAQVRFG